MNSKRTNCLYCENEGTQTALVKAGETMACPVHSSEWVRLNAPPTFRAVLEAHGIAPQLLNVGGPFRNGQKA